MSYTFKQTNQELESLAIAEQLEDREWLERWPIQYEIEDFEFHSDQGEEE